MRCRMGIWEWDGAKARVGSRVHGLKTDDGGEWVLCILRFLGGGGSTLFDSLT